MVTDPSVVYKRLVCQEFNELIAKSLVYRFTADLKLKKNGILCKIHDISKTAKGCKKFCITIITHWPNLHDIFKKLSQNVEVLQIIGSLGSRSRCEFIANDFAILLARMPALTEVRFQVFDDFGSQEIITVQVRPAFENLVSLEIASSIAEIFENARELRLLVLKGAMYENLLKNNPKLEAFHFHSKFDLIPLNGNYSSVKELFLKMDRTTGPELKDFVAAFPSVERLKVIIIGDLTFDPTSVVHGLNHLKTFRLAFKWKFMNLVKAAPQVTSIMLYDLKYSQYAEFRRLLKEMVNLRDLHVQGRIGIRLLKLIMKHAHLDHLCIKAPNYRSLIGEKFMTLLCQSTIPRVSMWNIEEKQAKIIRDRFYTLSDLHHQLASIHRIIINRRRILTNVYWNATDFKQISSILR